ncbi:MAG: hypothetical protein B7Y50_02430 [Hydrogenophilales bacterium 28-61-11]|nr:MAG: hypothetical protein B7Y50_02430 [Hydrogenophilales bacterium 28-61-11]OYZ58085.1 MAG: hypothetical protein B7Y21_04895 [Hydrogenophilales bacterium 16-61-112]OZA47761.1 MAG: hypothetical protein B7X81_04850 [Hydrogenophilales bacterium 17-61-76]
MAARPTTWRLCMLITTLLIFMNCANDSLMVDPVPIAQIPEPGTLAVLPLGLLGMLGLARRRRS